MTTQVIDDIETMSGDAQSGLDINWTDFWLQHWRRYFKQGVVDSASTASDADEFYIAGLLRTLESC